MWTEESIENYERLLESKGLPVIFDVEHLRRLIGVKKKDFYKLTNSIDACYTCRLIDKRNGGKRELLIPSFNLKIIQTWILNNILYTQSVSSSATGFIKGKSIVDNAEPHIGHKYIFKTDILNFFPSIKLRNIFLLFFYFGYTVEVSYILASLCTYEGYLPQGAPTSPYLSNLILRDFDIKLQNICSSLNYTYTRYADDITISSDTKITKFYIEYLLDTISQLLNSITYFLKLNLDKTKVLHPGQRKIITGVLVNKRLNVPKELLSEIRLEIYCLQKYGASNRLKAYNLKNNTDLNIASYRQKLYGKICFVNMINPIKAEKLYDQFYDINWMK
ncbi:reverse transcriptase domain-containing protein [Streptococcus parasanguinis]|uniref:reverse transcriptase domain-containing protein n=1 Tax=Streptococcus parasanguinis TaxID=1318 RepID=UPI00066E5140|nr:reverse transcriptase domain-containing protein [Streptococcus parasanguinis]